MTTKTRARACLLAMAPFLGASAHEARAQNAGVTSPTGTAAVAAPGTTGSTADQQSASPATPMTPSIQGSLGAYGDPGGIRAVLDAKGIDYNFTYIGEVLGNATGGAKRGATYEGRLDLQGDVDLERLAGLKGAAIHAEAFQIHGRGLTGNNTLDLFTVSNIEAFPSTKLYEAWYEQKLADDKVFVRVGQLAFDTEFAVSQSGTLFVNSTFGAPGIFANDLPSGGPAYPFGSPGVRLKYAPRNEVTLLAAVFDGDPAGPFIPGVNSVLPQQRDPAGLNFRLKDAPLLFTEGQYAYNQGKDAEGMAGTLKLGYVHHFGPFQSNDVPAGVMSRLRGDDFGYAIIDQVIYREPGTNDQGATVFLRASGAPGDRSLIDLYLDAGLTYKGLLPGRPDDTAGISGAYLRIAPDLATQDRLAGAAPLVRDYSGLIEATYQAVVLPGFSVQPDVQYLFHPGAHGVADPNTGQPIRDAAVFGLRATLHY